MRTINKLLKYTKAIELHKNGSLVKLYEEGIWEVKEEFIWYINYENKNKKVVIPKGFKTDFGSVPKFMRGFIDFTYLGYILHDFLYSEEGKILFIDQEIIPTRKESDKILYDSLGVESVNLIKRFLVYGGVRIGGRKHFKNKK